MKSRQLLAGMKSRQLLAVMKSRQLLAIIFIILPCFYFTRYTYTGISEEAMIKHTLTKEVEAYINKVSPKSNISPKEIVNKCIEHDIDIAFVLAQGQLESNFGVSGIASRTNSVWNVNSYDNRTAEYIKKNKLNYEHPDHSIEPYIRLIKTKYLGNNRTVHDLMTNFTSQSGHRYASSMEYEKLLKSIYNKISKTTNIVHLQNCI